MPLTFAHPAAVIPLVRWRLPLSGLVVGSMAPDFVYFVRLAPRGHFGHTLPGLFLFCLPAGLAVLWVFHRLLKTPLTELAPVAAQRRLARHLVAAPFDRPLRAVAAAVLLGALTHVVWDAFTHASGWGVAALPLLNAPIEFGAHGPVPGYKIAQHGSTVLGLSTLAAALTRWWRRAPQVEVMPSLDTPIRRRRAGLLVALPVLAGAGYAAATAATSTDPALIFAGRLASSVPGFAFVAALTYGLWRTSPVLARRTSRR